MTVAPLAPPCLRSKNAVSMCYTVSTMTNAEIADTFGIVGKILDLLGENPFRVRAYQRADQTIATLSTELRELYDAKGLDGLQEIDGIGKDLSLKIEELLNTGKLQYLFDLEKQVPKGLLDVMQIPGMGPKKTKFVWEKFQVESIADLEKLAMSGALTTLKGWGEKSVANILLGIETKRSMGGRASIATAWQLADQLVAMLKRSKLCKKVEIAGSLRRRKETIGDIDLLATSDQAVEVMQLFCTAPGVERVLGKGLTKSSVILKAGIQADLRVVEPEVFGAALQYFTGSKEHNIRLRSLAQQKGITINEYGAFEGTPENKGKRIAAATEEDVYAAVGVPWMAPELREDHGEIDAALAGELPALIEEKDLHGDLHMHSAFSDGSVSMTKMAKAAKDRGFSYIAMTDHASAMGMVRGIKEGNINEYLELVAEAREAVPGLIILAGAEVDIQEDGDLYLPDKTLKKLDWVVASVHNRFNQSREQMTKRIVTAIENSHVRLLAHPTTRLLLERPGVEFDVEAVFSAAKKHGVLLELNASVSRLDLSDVLCRRAKDMGILLSIDCDAHKVMDFDYRYGIAQARRAWLEPKDVVNTLPLLPFEQWLAS